MIKKEKLVLLHSIRGFAALIVVIAHSKFPFWCGGQEYIKAFPRNSWNPFDYLLFTLDMFTSNATVMVIIFFVLSGFFIAYSFEMNTWKLTNFYVNRSIRIYSPYLGSIIFTIILFKLATVINPELFASINPREYNQDLIHANKNFNFKTLAYTLGFVSNPVYIGYNYPYWSLLTEAMFYVIAPVFIKKPKLFLLITSILMVLGFISISIFDSWISFSPLVQFLTTYSVFFALGYFTFWLIFKYKIQDKLKNVNVWLFNITAIITLLTSMYGGFFVSHKITYIGGGIFTLIMIYRMIVYPVKVTFMHKFFISMGKISYSMYLIHVPIYILIYSILVKFTGQEVFYSRIYWIPAAIAVLVSYPFYYLVEHQSLKLIRRYKGYLRKKG